MQNICIKRYNKYCYLHYLPFNQELGQKTEDRVWRRLPEDSCSLLKELHAVFRDFGDWGWGFLEDFGVVDAGYCKGHWITVAVIQLWNVNSDTRHQFDDLTYKNNVSIHLTHQKHKLVHWYLRHFLKLTHIGPSIDLPRHNFLRFLAIEQKHVLPRLKRNNHSF